MGTITFFRCTLLFFIQLLIATPAFSQLKSVVYDFEGLDIGEADLPEGDYQGFDMKKNVSINPLGQSQMLGDRVLKLDINWSLGKAQFGKGISKFIELDASADYFNFYFYNPLTNDTTTKLDIVISEDDDRNNVLEDADDDKWKRSIIISRSSSWQLISLPLSSFSDNNTGGNGIFDAAFTNQAGKIFNIDFNFYKTFPGETSSITFMDMICFSEGALPTGNNILDLPSRNPSDHALLGAVYNFPDITPSIVEEFFPANPVKKLKYINSFIKFSENETTTANQLPGNEISEFLQRGYTPIITWEAMFSHLSRLDAAQPRLIDFMKGEFDSYIDAFGDKLKSYDDTIIIRFMHEFEGDWYPWSLVENDQDPNLYINVFRKVVDRVRARGASKVKWLWCVNGPSYSPVAAYNWIVGAYPGDAYVDIVACENFNSPVPGIPNWRSFRAGMAEPYYYLTKYFPQKPMFICESGCRERYSSEDPSSQSKAQWIAEMDKEVQSNFHNVRALIFFGIKKAHDYRLNSTIASLNSIETNIWNDDYYFENPSAPPLNASIISPGNNSTYVEGSTIVIKASTSGGIGTIQKVEFYANGTEIAEDLTDPYSYTWDNFPPGNYTLKAKATDSWNYTFTTPSIDINVDSALNTFCSATGNITRDKWSNFLGKTMAEIPVNTAPSSTTLLSLFEGPKNSGDNYASRIRGFICPPSTGNYTFWIASDNNSELYLSSTINPNDKVKIAQQDFNCSSRQWNKYDKQQSLPIPLIAGKSYYIEALHREGSLSDNLAVGWQLPDSTMERPIPGIRLSPFPTMLNIDNKQPLNPVPKITVSGPTKINKEEETILSTELDPSAVYQWKLNNDIIPMSNKSFLKATKPGLYRVKVIKNGTVSLSDTVGIIGDQEINNQPNNINTKDATETPALLKVYPNPNTGHFTIVVCMAASELAKIQLVMMNNLGQVVYHKEVITQMACINETVEIDRSIPSGVYTLKVIIGNKIENTNVVLLR
ncbi:MAG: Ig-like domain-containing protein [Bacteroidota bacterium]